MAKPDGVVVNKMAMMNSEVYVAFKSVGIDDSVAQKAAESLSAENLATKADIAELNGKISKLDKELAILKWMVGLVIAIQVLPFLKALLA